MKNEEKAKSLYFHYCNEESCKGYECTNCPNAKIDEGLIQMALWKDEQFSKQNKWHKVANDKVGTPLQDYNGHDWVLAQFQDHRDGFMYLPHIAEWSKDKQCWYVIESDDEEFVYEVLGKCIAWCELPKFEE